MTSTPTTRIIRDTSDVIALIDDVMHFRPTNSFVVVPIAGGPTARLDLDTYSTMRTRLAPAHRHWQGRPVIVAIYSDTDDMPLSITDCESVLPGITIVELIHVKGHHAKSMLDPHGTWTDVPQATSTREDLVAEAAKVNDPREAYEKAGLAWMSGDGATANTYIERCQELGGHPGLADLIRLTVNSIDPRTGE